VASTSGKGTKLEITLNEAKKINHLILQEEIAYGERVRKFMVEAWVSGNWVELCSGSVIGNKFITQFEQITTKKIRLNVSESIDIPIIKNLAVYWVKNKY
jgi:alpha-L-fucosidase